MPPLGACDPLADARAEVAALLRSLGVPDPLEKLRPIFSRVRQRWAGQVHIARTDPDEREERNRKIQEGLAAGLPAKAVAKQVGVHPATVWRKNKDWAI